MSENALVDTVAAVDVANVGGIESTTAELSPGVTVLTGENATNRTSFLQAIMAALGSDRATLKGDADEGSVELTVGGETYTRTLTRTNGSVAFGGDPYLDDPTLADLYAFLLENNEARRAIERGDDLRELIMRPVDTDEITREIRDLRSEREDIDERIDRLDDQQDRLPELKTRKQSLQGEIEETEAALETKRQRIEEEDTSVEAKQAYEEKIETLSQTRTDLQQVDRRIESERESIKSLEDERDDLRAKLDDIDEVSEREIREIEEEIQRLRGQIQGINSAVGDLQSVIQFNEDFLEDGHPDLVEQLDDGASDEPITDQLVEDSTQVNCWTCGSTVETTQIESTLEELRAVRNDRMDERKAIEEQIDELQEAKSELERQQRTNERTQQNLAEVESEIDRRRETIASLEDRKADLSEEIEALEAEVEEMEGEDTSDLLTLQEEASRLEMELDRTESELEDVVEEIERIEASLEDRDSLEAQREEVSERIADLRTRVEDLQENAIEQFNTHMETLLGRLDYDNLERIWIERTKAEVRDGRRKVDQDRFELHIVRSTDSGTVYEDTVDHLSESEREVTGLVFALAGYLVHDVHEEVPFMLLDSIEAIDSDRIATLVEYLDEHADYLVVALLEGDAAAVDDRHPRITSI